MSKLIRYKEIDFQRPIIVCGVHHSGTSLITGLLHLAGCWSGITQNYTGKKIH